MKSLLNKSVCLVMITVIMVMSIIPSVSAAKQVEEEEEQIRELAEALEFIFEEAVIKNEMGMIIEIDIPKIRKEVPPSPELNKLLAEIQKKSAKLKKAQAESNEKGLENKSTNLIDQCEPEFSTFSSYSDRYSACVADKLGDFVGDFIPIFVIASVYEYIANGDYYNAAKKIVKAGIKGSVWGIAASLSWIAIECTWEQRYY